MLAQQRAPLATQFGANSSTSGVYAACVKLRDTIAEKLGFDPSQTVFEGSRVRQGSRSVPLSSAVGHGRMTAEDAIQFGDLDDMNQLSSFGAQYARWASTP